MTRLHRALALLAAALAVAAWHSEPPGRIDNISPLDLADRIVRQDAALRVVDVRPRPSFDQFHVPGATQMTLDDLRRQPISLSAQIVLYADDDDRAMRSAQLLRTRGYVNVVVLREGISAWISRVLEPRLARDATAARTRGVRSCRAIEPILRRAAAVGCPPDRSWPAARVNSRVRPSPV